MKGNGFVKIAIVSCCAALAAALLLPAVALASTPARVTGLRAVSSVNTASLTWSKAGHASSYKVYRAAYDSSSYKLIKTTASRAYVASGLSAGARYRFKVRAYNGRYGAYSAAVVAALKPADVTGLARDADGKLTWDTCGGAATYKVSVDVAGYGCSYCVVATHSADFSYMATLFGEQEFTFTVTPVSSCGVEGASSALAPTAHNMTFHNVVAGTKTHETLVVPANMPLNITFDPSTMGCSANIHFTTGTFTNTNAAMQNVRLHSDGLPAGVYHWKCSMDDCCYGTLVVEDPATTQNITFDNALHQTLTAPANTPLSITFDPSTMGCSANMHFTTGTFTKTSPAMANVTYYTDGLPAGTYQWKCSMDDCCYGTLVIE